MFLACSRPLMVGSMVQIAVGDQRFVDARRIEVSFPAGIAPLALSTVVSDFEHLAG